MRHRLASGVLIGAATLIFSPGAAASTYSVDNDRVQCPLAEFTDLSEAVNTVEQGDVIYICPGTYTVPGGASSSGLKIEKNVSLIGAGADQVFVQPDTSGPSIAAPVPNERDDLGNVITVRRRTIQLFEVNISGLTVRAPNASAPGGVTAVEGGIAMVDVTEGSIADVRVEGLVPAAGPGTGPYASAPLSGFGHGLILANTIQDTHNLITVTDSEITDFNRAGVVVDNRVLNGSAPVGNQSRMVAVIDDSSIVGGEPTAAIDQNGIEVWGSTAADNGASLTLSDSVVGATGASDGSEAGIFMRGANVGASLVGGSDPEANDFSTDQFGIANRNFANSGAASATLDATHNWFGALAPALISTTMVNTAPTAPAQPPAPAGPGPPVDALPSLEWDTAPSPGATIEHGHVTPLVALAGDDFGVNRVEFFADVASLGVAANPPLDGERVYHGSYKPTAAEIGTSKVLSAVAADSRGQTRTVTVTVNIVEDVTAPETTIDAGPAEGALTNNPTLQFRFSSNDSTASFTCSVDGAGFGPCSGDGQHTAGPLGDGAHTFAVRAGDPQGNIDGTPASRSFTVDTTPPETKITSKLKRKQLRKRKATFKFTSAGEPSASFECALDGRAFEPCSAPEKLKKLKFKKHKFQVRATDAAGNTDPTPAKAKFRIKRKKR